MMMGICGSEWVYVYLGGSEWWWQLVDKLSLFWYGGFEV